MFGLTEHQLAVASRALDRESEARRHLVVSLSGAHAYGFPSPDSDLDLKAIHIAPTSRLVGLSSASTTADRLEVVEGVEIDYTSNELGPVLAGILGGNGNYAERILGAMAMRESPELTSLRPIVARALSRRLHRHYRGFARGQLADFDAAAEPTAKKLLYVLRTALTGVNVLRGGGIVTDVTALYERDGFGAAAELVQRKRAGERVALDEPMRARWRAEVERALALLDEAHDQSPLPAEPANAAEVEAWLLEVRRRLW